MNPRTKFFRSLALLGALGVGLAACDEDTITQPTPTPTITASPANITLQVGGTQAIVASVTNVAAGVSFESLQTSVATVSEGGVVTGVAPGTATIRVSSTAQPSLQTAVGVTVTGGTIPGGGDESVVIQSITEDQTFDPVDPDDVDDQIDVTLSVQRGSATSLVVQLIPDGGDGTPIDVCSQTFGTSGTAADGKITDPNLQLSPNGNSVICSINTAAVQRDDDGNPAADANGQGIPLYPNDDYVVRAVLRQDGTELDAARSDEPLTFNNTDMTHLRVVSERGPELDDDNFEWVGGDQTVIAVPISYRGRVVSEVEFTYNPPGFAAITEEIEAEDADEEGFVFFLPADEVPGDDGIEGVRDPNFDVSVDVIASGQTFPGANTNQFLDPGDVRRLDVEAPDAGDLELVNAVERQGWINDEYDVADGHGEDAGVEPDDDDGVGVGTVEYRLYPAEDFDDGELEEAFEDGTPVEDLEETESNDEFVIVARVSDRLGNVSYTYSTDGAATQEIGVDLTAPELELTSEPGNMVVNPTEDYVFAFDDELSQFGNEPVFIRAPAVDQDDGACPIGDGTEADDCEAEGTTDSTIEPAELDEDGYYTIEVYAQDRAGNRSETITRLALVDTTNPEVSDLDVDEDDLEGGESANFTATAEDNLNLSHAMFFLAYENQTYFIQYEPATPLGSFGIAFDTETEADLSTSAPFIGAIQDVDGGDSPDGDFHEANRAQWSAFDLAGNVQVALEMFDYDRSGADPFDGSWEVRVVTNRANDDVCSPGDDRDACTIPTSIRVGVEVEGDINDPFDRPFSRIIVLRDIGGDRWVYVGESSSRSAIDDQNNARTWTYPGVEFEPGEDFPAGDHDFRVLGVTNGGDGLISNAAAVTVEAGGP